MDALPVVEVGGRFANAKVQDLLEFCELLPVAFQISHTGIHMFLTRVTPALEPEPKPAANPRKKRGRRPGRKPGSKAKRKLKGPISVSCTLHKVEAGIPCKADGTLCRIRRREFREGNEIDANVERLRQAAQAAPEPIGPLPTPEKKSPLVEAPAEPAPMRVSPAPARTHAIAERIQGGLRAAASTA